MDFTERQLQQCSNRREDWSAKVVCIARLQKLFACTCQLNIIPHLEASNITIDK